MKNTYNEMKDSGVAWIGEIPNHWKAHKAKVYIKITNGSAPQTEGDIPVYGSGANCFKTCGEYKEGPAVLVGRKGSIDKPRYLEGRYWNIDTSFDVKTICNFSLRLYYYLALCFDYQYYVSKTTLPSMTQTNYRNMFLPIPPLPEQKAIAAYLDDKCGTIDEIIEQAKATIEEYKAWKSSVIFEAVTKGLDPNAEMKDSGVEWIGKVPKHWDVCKLKYLCSMQAGKNISSELIQDNGEYPVYGGNGLRGYYSKFNMEQDCILIGRQGALCGNVHIVSGKYWATEHAVITRVTNIENLQHLYYLLIGMNLNQYASDAAAQPGLAVGAIKDLYVPLTPTIEQEAIVDYLDRKCSAIDEIIAEKEALISDMEAYKKSLIFETVTGKRKVC